MVVPNLPRDKAPAPAAPKGGGGGGGGGGCLRLRLAGKVAADTHSARNAKDSGGGSFAGQAQKSEEKATVPVGVPVIISAGQRGERAGNVEAEGEKEKEEKEKGKEKEGATEDDARVAVSFTVEQLLVPVESAAADVRPFYYGLGADSVSDFPANSPGEGILLPVAQTARAAFTTYALFKMSQRR